jgi:hypothetical protein
MIFKFTILALLAFSSVAYKQDGKADLFSKESKSNRLDEVDKSRAKRKNKHEPSFKNRTDLGRQGLSEKRGNQYSKSELPSNAQKHLKRGKGHNALRQKIHKSNNQSQYNYRKGYKGGKPYKFEKLHRGKYSKAYAGKQVKMKSNKGYYDGPLKNKYSKGHPNFGYLYLNISGVYSEDNYGYWRSREAKNKHKNYHPKSEYQAVEGFTFIIVRNNFLYNETDNKIRLVRSLLYEKRKSGHISDGEYNHTIKAIEDLEERREGLEINFNL